MATVLVQLSWAAEGSLQFAIGSIGSSRSLFTGDSILGNGLAVVDLAGRSLETNEEKLAICATAAAAAVVVVVVVNSNGVRSIDFVDKLAFQRGRPSGRRIGRLGILFVRISVGVGVGVGLSLSLSLSIGIGRGRRCQRRGARRSPARLPKGRMLLLLLGLGLGLGFWGARFVVIGKVGRNCEIRQQEAAN